MTRHPPSWHRPWPRAIPHPVVLRGLVNLIVWPALGWFLAWAFVEAIVR